MFWWVGVRTKVKFTIGCALLTLPTFEVSLARGLFVRPALLFDQGLSLVRRLLSHQRSLFRSRDGQLGP